MSDSSVSLEIIQKLVSFDTTSSRSNLELIDFVDSYLTGYGLQPVRVYNHDRTKANLYCRIGPDVGGGVVLSGHTDVVPVAGQDWQTEPFEPQISDGKLFARGTTDMKSFVGCAMGLVPTLVNRTLGKPVHLAFSYDEEVGCLGAPGLIDYLTQQSSLPAVVIVGEPTSMKVVNSHKGLVAYRTSIAGQEAHSSAPQLGANAILAAGQLLTWLVSLSRRLASELETSERFTPPHATLNVGQIKGGQAVNIIPRYCHFDWEMRTLPDQDSEPFLREFEAFATQEVLPWLQSTAPDADIRTEKLSQISPLRPIADSPAESLALILAQQNETLAVSYGTEAGLFQNAELPTVVCGPGDIAQAHQPNEFIELSQIAACDDFLNRLADQLTA